jgi:hypothetical protein
VVLKQEGECRKRLLFVRALGEKKIKWNKRLPRPPAQYKHSGANGLGYRVANEFKAVDLLPGASLPLDSSTLEVPFVPVKKPPPPQSNLKISTKADEVRLWGPGAKDRCCQGKLKIYSSNDEAVKEMAKSYIEGLC